MARKIQTDVITSLEDTLEPSVADTARRMLGEMRVKAGSVLNVRQVKAHMTKVLQAARSGKAQIVKRQGDKMPVVMVSLEAMAEAATKVVGHDAFYGAMRARLKRATRTLEIRDSGSREQFNMPKADVTA